jgi:hypothetical protein
MTIALPEYGVRIEIPWLAALSPGRVARLDKSATAKSAQHPLRLIMRKSIVAM